MTQGRFGLRCDFCSKMFLVAFHKRNRRFCSRECQKNGMAGAWANNLREQRLASLAPGMRSLNQKHSDEELREIWDRYVASGGKPALMNIVRALGYSTIPPRLKTLVGIDVYKQTLKELALPLSGRYRTGRVGEKKVRATLVDLGYYVMRSAGSKGVWDLLAFKPGAPTLLIQVKVGRGPGGAEMETLRNFVAPEGWIKQLWVLPKYRKPEVTQL